MEAERSIFSALGSEMLSHLGRTRLERMQLFSSQQNSYMPGKIGVVEIFSSTSTELKQRYGFCAFTSLGSSNSKYIKCGRGRLEFPAREIDEMIEWLGDPPLLNPEMKSK